MKPPASRTHLSLRQLLLVDLLDLGAVGQQVAQFHIALPQLLVPAVPQHKTVSVGRASVSPPLSLFKTTFIFDNWRALALLNKTIKPWPCYLLLYKGDG